MHCTNFNIRFYPQVQQARALVRHGALGDDLERARRLPPGLAPAPHRLELAARAGQGRRASRRRRHRLALARPRCSSSPAGASRRVLADLATTIPVRRRPAGEVETFAAADDVEREDAPMQTEDLAHLLLRFERRCARLGRRLAGQRRAEELAALRGRRRPTARSRGTPSGTRSSGSATASAPNELLSAIRPCSSPRRAARTQLAGRPRGGLRRRRSRSSTALSTPQSRRASRPASPTTRPFATGTWENVLGEAVAHERAVNDDGWR